MEYLVGVLQEHIRSRLQLHTSVDDGLQDSPHVIVVQVDLVSEFCWLVGLYTENLVRLAVLCVGA